MNRRKRLNGSILIEALIAVLVLGLGIFGIAKLQGTLFKTGSNAQSRNVAMKLAQMKADDLRTFQRLSAPTDGGGNPIPWVSMPTTMAYDYVQDTVRGDFPAGPSDLCAAADAPCGGVVNYSTTVVGNTRYSLGWTVDDFFVDENGVVSTSSATATRSDFKRVVVTATWFDPSTNATETAQLVTNIAALTSLGSKLLADPVGIPEGPRVKYTPGEAPDVIAVDTDGEAIETTLPEPAIKSIAGTDYFFTQFETVTFTGTTALRQEEFLNIECSCEFASNLNSATGDAFPVARSIWHPDHGKEADEHAQYVASFFHPEDHEFIAQDDFHRADLLAGKMVKKVTALPDVNNLANQHPLCGVCCRDHHDATAGFLQTKNDNGVADDFETNLAGSFACDPTDDDQTDGDGARFNCTDPYRPTSNYRSDSDGGDHKHYMAGGNESFPGASPPSNRVYVEACRLKRINGIFHVYQDWHLHSPTFVAAPEIVFTNSTSNGIVGVLSQYQTYIKDYVTQVIEDGLNMPTTTVSNPAKAATWPADAFSANSDKLKFISRGIYMDYLDPFTLDRLQAIAGTTSFFENAPFNEINLTRLTDWQLDCSPGDNDEPQPGDTNCVTNHGIRQFTNSQKSAVSTGNNIAADFINRGEVRFSGTPFDLITKIKLSNTGLVDANALQEPTTAPDASDRSSDDQTVIYTASVPRP